MPRLTRAERRLLRLSLLELGRVLELPVEPSVDDSANMARSFHSPLWRVRRMFSSEGAFRSFVVRKLDQADERASVLRIAAIFAALPTLRSDNPMTSNTETQYTPECQAGEPLAAAGEPTATADHIPNPADATEIEETK